jgi:hypothetical protein
MLQEEFDAISKGSATATAAEAVGPVFGSMTPR